MDAFRHLEDKTIQLLLFLIVEQFVDISRLSRLSPSSDKLSLPLSADQAAGTGTKAVQLGGSWTVGNTLVLEQRTFLPPPPPRCFQGNKL